MCCAKELNDGNCEKRSKPGVTWSDILESYPPEWYKESVEGKGGMQARSVRKQLQLSS